MIDTFGIEVATKSLEMGGEEDRVELDQWLCRIVILLPITADDRVRVGHLVECVGRIVLQCWYDVDGIESQ